MDEQMDDGLERLREFVLARRKPMKWRQQTVADRTGLSQSWVASLESRRLGGVPLDETLVKLAKGMALPTESPGSLYGFLDLLVRGYFDSDEVEEVARGSVSPDVAIERNKGFEGNDAPPAPPESADQNPSVFLTRQLRAEGRELVLKLLKRDLPPDDFAAARRLIELLYDQRDLTDGYEPPPNDFWAPNTDEQR